MKMIDLMCQNPACGIVWEDFLLRAGMRPLPFTCPVCRCKTLDKAMLKAPAVHGDEIDIEIKHGLCWADGSPRRFRSKSEIKHAAKLKGLTNIVEHVPSPGSDKNRKRNTQRFV